MTSSTLYAQHIAQPQSHLSDDEASRLAQYQQRAQQWRSACLSAPAKAVAPLLALPYDDAELAHITEVARTIRSHAKSLIVVGTGGSSLGGKTLCALAGDAFPVHFIENLDPHSMQRCLENPLLPDSHLLMVSKSGGTMETLCQSFVLLDAMKASKTPLSQRAHAITMNTSDNPLRTLAAQHDIPVLEHHADIGGRFSVLSNVGLLPAAAAGLDIAAIAQGARSVIDALRADAPSAPLLGAAWQAALMPSRPMSVLMPYCDRLVQFGYWYRQLWAESLGKNGLGSTPVRAQGAVDQHSQLQLYLDGPKDKSFTLITLEHAGHGAPIPLSKLPTFSYLNGQHIGDVMQALQHGTMQTLERHGLPLRTLALAELTEAALGALLMHFMLETICCADLIGVDAFDQPAVEESKQLAKAALMASAQRVA